MSDNIEKQGSTIALIVVFGMVIIVGIFVFFHFMENATDEYNQQLAEKAYIKGIEDAETIRKINERGAFINNIHNNIKTDIFRQQQGFSEKYYFTITNNSNYKIQEVSYRINYVSFVNSLEVINNSEYVYFDNLKGNTTQTKPIPFHKCITWTWKIETITCNDLLFKIPE